MMPREQGGTLSGVALFACSQGIHHSVRGAISNR